MRASWFAAAAQKINPCFARVYESGRQDLNLRPLRPERSALAKLSYSPWGLVSQAEIVSRQDLLAKGLLAWNLAKRAVRVAGR